MRLEAVTSLTAVRSTIFNAAPPLEMIYGEAPEPLIVQVIGVESAGKSELLAALGAQPNGPYFNKQRIHFDKKAGKQHIMYIESDGPFSAADSKVVCVLDASNEDRLAESLRHLSVRVTNSSSMSPDSIVFVVKGTAGGVSLDEVKKTLKAILELDDDEAGDRVLSFDGNTAPEKLVAALAEDLEDAEDPADEAEGGGEDDDDEDDGPSMQAIAKKAFKGAAKCIAGIQEIEVSNALVSVHVVMENLPVGDVLAETDAEKIRRNRMEFQFRIMNIMEFGEGLEDVSELAESWQKEEEEKEEKPKSKAPVKKQLNRLTKEDDSDDDLSGGCSSDCSSDE